MAQASAGNALACAVTAIISIVVPFAAGLAPVGRRAHRPAGLPLHRLVLAAATICDRIIAFLIAGLGDMGGGPQCLHRWADRIVKRGQGTPTVVVSSLISGSCSARRWSGCCAMVRLRHLIFRCDRKRGQYALLARMHMQGGRRRQAVFRRGLVLAVGAAGLQHWDHDRVADWVVGVVASAGAIARNQMYTN